MANKPKTLDNSVCRAFLREFLTFSDVCATHPKIDDILTGCLQLATPGSSSTRTLRRQVIFNVLQNCEELTVSAVDSLTYRKFALRTCEAYAQTSRIVSTAIRQYVETLPMDQRHPSPSTWQSQYELDKPHRIELERALQEQPSTAPLRHGRAEWWLPVGTTLAQSVDQRPMLAELRTRLPKLYDSTEDVSL